MLFYTQRYKLWKMKVCCFPVSHGLLISNTGQLIKLAVTISLKNFWRTVTFYKWKSKILLKRNQGTIFNKPCDIVSEQGRQPALWQTASHLCIEQFFSLLQVWVHLTSTCLMHFTFWYERRQLQCLDMYALQGGQGPGWQSLKKESNYKLKKTGEQHIRIQKQ